MEVDTHNNKCIVYIIESLPDGDLKTGRNLYEKLRQEWLFNNDYDVDKIADRIKKKIVKDSSYRNVTQVRKFR